MMSIRTYRFNRPIGVVLADSTVTELPPGSDVCVDEAAMPDSKGMTMGTHKGKSILVFQRDLDEQAEYFTAVPE
jgi:hypothetical protein